VLLGYAGAIDASLEIGMALWRRRWCNTTLDLRAFGLKRGQTFDGDSQMVDGAIELFCSRVSGFQQVILAPPIFSASFLS
jgi:adenosylhomocysteine nucleosidase